MVKAFVLTCSMVKAFVLVYSMSKAFVLACSMAKALCFTMVNGKGLCLGIFNETIFAHEKHIFNSIVLFGLTVIIITADNKTCNSYVLL